MKNVSTISLCLVIAGISTACGDKSQQKSPKVKTDPTEVTPTTQSESATFADQLWQKVQNLVIPSLAEHTFKPARVGESEVCGVAEYKTGTGDVCGVQTYLAQRSSACTIAQTITHEIRRREPQCGAERYEQRASPVCGTDSVTEWSSWGTWSCKRGESVQTETRVRWSGPEPRQLCRFTQPRTCEHPSFPVVLWKECIVSTTKEHVYDSCRHPSHGVESYNSCAHLSFGVSKFNKCEITKTESESAEYAIVAQKSAEVAVLKLMNSALRIHAANKDEQAMKCVVHFAKNRTSIGNVANLENSYEELTEKNFGEVKPDECKPSWGAPKDLSVSCAQKDDENIVQSSPTVVECSAQTTYKATLDVMKLIHKNLTKLSTEAVLFKYNPAIEASLIRTKKFLAEFLTKE